MPFRPAKNDRCLEFQECLPILRMYRSVGLGYARRSNAQFPEGPFDGRNVATIHDPLPSVEDHRRHDLASEALSPLPARHLVLADVTACIVDTFVGEITFHPAAVWSAGADVDDDLHNAGSSWAGRGYRKAME